MSIRETYKLGIDIVTPEPLAGTGGDLLNDNAKVIADTLETHKNDLDGATSSPTALKLLRRDSLGGAEIVTLNATTVDAVAINGDTVSGDSVNGSNSIGINSGLASVSLLSGATSIRVADPDTGTPYFTVSNTGVTLAASLTLGATSMEKARQISALADPNADRLLFWDDSAGLYAYLTASTGLSISGTNITVQSASETQSGISETATAAEVTTGTDTLRYITPANLTSITKLGTIATGTWAATAVADAYIASAATWNAKVGPTRNVNTTAPLTGGGTLAADLTLAISAASGGAAGSMSAAHYTLVNNSTAAATASTLVLRDGSGNSALNILALPTTSSTAGQITINSTRVLHSYGTNNFFVGTSCGNFTLTGQQNYIAANGGTASISSGSYNTALGYQALNGCSTGSDNLAIGRLALAGNGTSSVNLAIGNATLYQHTTGSSNVAIGGEACRDGTTRNSVVAIGYQAGYNTLGTGVTYIGRAAGYTDGTTATTASLTNATAIGYYAQVTQNNSVILGGTGSYAADVGIGVTAPTAKLDIAADKIRLRTAKTPATAGDTGNAGDICWDASYIYICTAASTWKRAAIATW